MSEVFEVTAAGLLFLGIPLLVVALVVVAVVVGVMFLTRGSRDSGGAQTDMMAMRLHADMENLAKRVEALETLLIERAEPKK